MQNCSEGISYRPPIDHEELCDRMELQHYHNNSGIISSFAVETYNHYARFKTDNKNDCIYYFPNV